MPKEGSLLNYRIIGFSVPPHQNTLDYTLEIAAGSYNSQDSFRHNIIRTIHSKTSKIIAEIPSFGSKYTWQVAYTFEKSSKTTSALFHFSTGIVPEADTSIIRLSITKPASKYKDAYIFLDDTKALYDMNGNPIWYLPKIEGKSITPRDLKLSEQGTITFMFDPPYEINYYGDVLWKPPVTATMTGDNSEHFHHQFSRLSNGHYMVLGEDSVAWKPVNKKIQFGTIIEYDEHGNVTWSWKSADYLTGSVLKYFIPPDGIQNTDVHENSFHFDEKNKNIYVSFKNINCILKVKYPEGTVTNAYFGTFTQGIQGSGNNLYCGQHSISQTYDGYLLFFNNNSCHPDSYPAVEILQEPLSENDTLKKVWEYECKSDLKFPGGFPSGGNVIELSDHSIFVSTATPDNKVFIVNRDKEIIWSAAPQRWNKTEKRWLPVFDYRASIIQNRKDLERMIWNAEENTTQPAISLTPDLPVVSYPAPQLKTLSGTQ